MMAGSSNRGINIKGAVLNDLASRFLINVSSEERNDSIKLCSFIELAHWFYLDLMRPEDPSLPACNLKEFMRALFQHCPWLLKNSVTQDLDKLISEWKAHKFKKPVRGAIILNQDCTKCILVQGYPSGTSWGFPKGKLEEGETDQDAAVREVYEETGFDIRGLIQEQCYLDASVHDSHARMYLIEGVPEDTVFQPKTRNEIRSIKWFNIKDLPSYKKDKTSSQALGKSSNNFFMVIPFIGQLRKWQQNRKKNKAKGISASFKPVLPNQAQPHSQSPVRHLQTQSLRSQSSPYQVPRTTTPSRVGVLRSTTSPLLPTPAPSQIRNGHAPQLSSQASTNHSPLIPMSTPPQPNNRAPLIPMITPLQPPNNPTPTPLFPVATPPQPTSNRAPIIPMAAPHQPPSNRAPLISMTNHLQPANNATPLFPVTTPPQPLNNSRAPLLPITVPLQLSSNRAPLIPLTTPLQPSSNNPTSLFPVGTPPKPPNSSRAPLLALQPSSNRAPLIAMTTPHQPGAILTTPLHPPNNRAPLIPMTTPTNGRVPLIPATTPPQLSTGAGQVPVVSMVTQPGGHVPLLHPKPIYGHAPTPPRVLLPTPQQYQGNRPLHYDHSNLPLTYNGPPHKVPTPHNMPTGGYMGSYSHLLYSPRHEVPPQQGISPNPPQGPPAWQQGQGAWFKVQSSAVLFTPAPAKSWTEFKLDRKAIMDKYQS